MPMIEQKQPYGSDSVVGIILDAAEKVRQNKAELEQSLVAANKLAAEAIMCAIASKKMEQECLKSSLEDPLTGCYNRNYYERISKTEFDPNRDDGMVAAIYVDVNNLKLVNDTQGHDAGDVLLQSFADLLQSGSRKSGNTVIRLGGDEFVIISRLHPGEYIDTVENVPGDGESTDGSKPKIGFEDSLKIMMERIAREGLNVEPPDQPISFAYGIAVYDKELDEKTPHGKLSVWARNIGKSSKLDNTLIRADKEMLARKIAKRQNI